MEFFLNMIPPTATAQMKKVRVVNNRPMFYEPKKVKEAHKTLTTALMEHKPDKPLEGPLALRALWLYPGGKNHKHGEWRITKPDTDNLEKLLKDCMTKVGFWKDDAQVVQEFVEKHWVRDKSGIYIEVVRLEVDFDE